MNTDAIRDFTLWARGLLTQETGDLLRSVYGLKADGTFLSTTDLPALQTNAEAAETRHRLEQWMADEKDAGIQPAAAMAKLLKEVAFTHLNRLVALKLLEHPERRVVRRAALGGYPEPNGFRMYLPDHEGDYSLYQQGTAPLDELSESPRDRAYRHFLLWQYGELAKEVRVLFDPDNLASRLLPRPKVLREIIEKLNGEALQEAWKPGNEETIGWVYQFFIAEEKAAAFKRVFKDKKKFLKEDIPAATQVFTPRWIVKFLVQNSLGRLWVSMHPDSQLSAEWDYLVPPAGDPSVAALKSIREIRLLDPATGTMHFGLVAFDMLVGMYREEIANAGNAGWPEEPPVTRDEDIPAAILANNLFGIDIDLRAVQLSALALFVRAKAHNRNAVLTDSNLACADVAMFRGPHRNKIVAEMSLPAAVSRQLFDQFCDLLDEASMMGSLVRLERLFQEKLGADQLKIAIDAYVRKKASEGIDESYFENETTKGLRLLELLTRRYDVVFTNPPYMSNRNMNKEMSASIRSNYKNSKGDLYSAFIERCAELTKEGGRLAMITQQSFMFVSTYDGLRRILLGNTAIETVAHVGPRAFDEVQGEKVNTTAFVIRREGMADARLQSLGIYFRLIKEPDAESKRISFEQALTRRRRRELDRRIYEYRQGDFADIPGSPWVYWITAGLRRLYLYRTNRALAEVAKPWIGLQTNDNTRFVRLWWEAGRRLISLHCPDASVALESGARWFPYMKGGRFARWYGNQEYVVNWERDGHEMKALAQHLAAEGNSRGNTALRNFPYYFQRGATWTKVTSGRFSLRLSPGGFIYDVGGCSVFPSSDYLWNTLGILNSSLASVLLKYLSPTLNYEVGQVEKLPVPNATSSHLANLAEQAVSLAKIASEESETTYEFTAPPLWPDGTLTVMQRDEHLAELEKQIDEEVYRLYGISNDDREVVEAELASPTENMESNNDGDAEDEETEQGQEGPVSQQELAAKWVSYAVGVALGRFQPGIAGVLGCGRFAPEVATRLRDLADQDGIMVLEEGHPDDLARRVLAILNAIYGDTEAERIIRTATASAAPLRDAVADYLAGEFFRDHLSVKRHRKRPVYWLIQSPKKNYSVYMFHERASPDSLSLLRGKRYLGGRLNFLHEERARLNQAVLKGDKDARRKGGEIAELIEDLEEFDRRMEAATRVRVKDKDGHDVTVRWEPELDDGVYINAAPLHDLLPSWREVNPKKAWQELAAGDYDWSHTAMRYWPQRVLAKCKDNKSYAIAHGLA
jgi:N-6 DNA Methylase